MADQPDISRTLADLQARFLSRIGEDEAKMGEALGGLAGPQGEAAWKTLTFIVHRYHGSAATFGFEALGNAAGELDEALEELSETRRPQAATEFATLVAAFMQALGQTRAPKALVIDPVPEKATGKSYSILVVEDDERQLAMLQTLLRQQGYRANGVASGQAALARIAQKKPDAVLLDGQLSDMDGLALLQQLKSSAGTRRIPVVMLTARNAERMSKASLSLGASACLGKPVSGRELSETIEKALV